MVTLLASMTGDSIMKTNFKVHKRKIDIFLRHFRDKQFYYECSSMAYKTCKEAKQSFCTRHGLDTAQVKCRFADSH